MKNRYTAVDHDVEYGRDIRVAAVVSLAAVIASFLFVPQPQVQPYRLNGRIDAWQQLDRSLPVIDLPSPPVHKAQGVVVPGSGDGPVVQTIDPNTDFPEIAGPVDDVRVEPMAYWRVEKKPALVHQVAPAYPEMARLAGIEGLVQVWIVVDTLGNVASAEVARGSGNAQLDEAAIGAARQFRFSPGYQRDRPVPVMMSVPFNFKLE